MATGVSKYETILFTEGKLFKNLKKMRNQAYEIQLSTNEHCLRLTTQNSHIKVKEHIIIQPEIGLLYIPDSD